MLTLVLGGARGGKSAYAIARASASGGRVLFVATAEALDEEMRARIERHRRERPAGWELLEEPLEVSARLAERMEGHQAVIVDCLTLLVSNLLLRARDGGPEPEAEIEALLKIVSGARPRVWVVSNEVGWGLVPESPLGRRFRDLLGWANQRFAEAAEEVVLLVAGLEMRLKGG